MATATQLVMIQNDCDMFGVLANFCATCKGGAMVSDYFILEDLGVMESV